MLFQICQESSPLYPVKRSGFNSRSTYWESGDSSSTETQRVNLGSTALEINLLVIFHYGDKSVSEHFSHFPPATDLWSSDLLISTGVRCSKRREWISEINLTVHYTEAIFRIVVSVPVQQGLLSLLTKQSKNHYQEYSGRYLPCKFKFKTGWAFRLQWDFQDISISSKTRTSVKTSNCFF